MLRHATTGWLIYYVDGGELFPFGVAKSEEAARADLEVLHETQPTKAWKTQSVLFVGWGDVVFASNETPSLEEIAPRQ